MKRIAIAGATGMLGWPVAKALADNGFEVTALIRSVKDKKDHANINWIEGDLKEPETIRTFLYGQDAVHLNLSVKQSERETDWHAEEQGLENLLRIAQEARLKKVSYLSSLIMNYQADGFNWWVFRLKQKAVNLVKQSGLSAIIFYPSTFMETLVHQYKAGSFLILAGESKYKQYFIAAEDYAQQVVRSYKLPGHSGVREYVVQGATGYTTDEAIALFKKQISQKLFTLRAPLGLIRFYGKFIQKMNYGYHILEALNNYPEKFEAESTWEELGKPEITLEKFSKRV
ncbi:MAG: NAD(P)H-binding protein [Cyclobacteriaceae bacterium]|nr:NAD(P)H-binding protein [Cyclobacteriaceae bacterium]